MRKEFTIFILLIIIPTTLAVQTQFSDNYTVNKDIRVFKTSDKPNFQALINTKYTINLFNKEEQIQKITPKGQAAFQIENKIINNSLLWVTGTKFPGSFIILNQSEIVKHSDSFRGATHSASFIHDSKVLTSVPRYETTVHSFDEEKIWSRSFDQGKEDVFDQHDTDNDDYKELLLGAQSGRFIVLGENTKQEWEVKRSEGMTIGKYLPQNKILLKWPEGIALYQTNGTLDWEKDVTGFSGPVNLSDSLVYSKDSELVYLDYEDGEVTDTVSLDHDLKHLKKYRGEDWLIGFQGENVSIFSLKGEKIHSFQVENLEGGPQFTQYDSDERKEVAVSSENTVHIVEIQGGRDQPKINQSLDETVFVGSGREMLKAAALNKTSFVARDYSDVEEEVNQTGLKPLGVGEISGIDSINSVNDGFNVSRKKYYAGSQRKKVYVAALAARDNASLTFDRKEADRDFSNYTIQELQDVFIEEFEPHHIAVADLESDRGVLAAYMAVRQGVMPVHFDQEYSYPEKDSINPEKWNRDNGVIKLKDSVRDAFNRIGENRKTVFEGKHISILEGPRKMYQDPVEKGVISDPADGEYFFSDLAYGDLNDDDRLEAGVGRYPQDLETSSVLYHRSLKREKGEDALVASEYLHSNWPVILATFGGGMWDGKNTGYVLEQQGYDTTRLVEQRSEPASFMLDILGVPTRMDRFVNTVDSSQEKIAALLGESSAKAIKNAAYIIRGLQYAEQTLEIYLEFDWMNWDLLDQELDLPEEASYGELQDLILSFLPDRYPELNEDNLEEELQEADLVYYQGVGNSTGWTLPNNSTGIIDDRYTGENRLTPGEVPGTDRLIVWDNSDNAGTREGEMKEAFLDRGVSTYLGTSSANYYSYSSHMATKFFKYGDTPGGSMVDAVNSLRSSFLVPSPEKGLKTGFRDKMERSLSLYGNPETVKDPVEKPDLNSSKTCSRGACTLKVRIRPDPRFIGSNGSRQYMFNTTDYLLQDFAPITPLYRFRYELPPGSEMVDQDIGYEYREAGNLSAVRNLPLSHGQEFYNKSLNFKEFPEELYRINTSNDLEYVQTAVQYRNNSSDRILEKATLEVEYEPPAALTIGKDGKILTADIYSHRSRDVELVYELNGDRKTRELDISEGENTVKLENLSYGKHSIEAAMIDEEVLSRDSREIVVAEPLDIYLFAPDIHKGSQRKIRAVIENPNSFKVDKDLELGTSSELQMGFMERKTKEVRVDPGSTEHLNWRVIGIEEGNASVSLGSEDLNLKVKPEMDITSELSPIEFTRTIVSPRVGFRQEITSETLRLEQVTPQGSIKIISSPEHESRLLVTDNFRVNATSYSSREVKKISTDTGYYIESVKGGVRKVENNLDRDPDAVLGYLVKETEKLIQRSDYRPENLEYKTEN